MISISFLRRAPRLRHAIVRVAEAHPRLGDIGVPGGGYGYVDTQQLYWYQGALMARIDKKCPSIEIPAAPDSDNSKSNKIERFCREGSLHEIQYRT